MKILVLDFLVFFSFINFGAQAFASCEAMGNLRPPEGRLYTTLPDLELKDTQWIQDVRAKFRRGPEAVVALSNPANVATFVDFLAKDHHIKISARAQIGLYVLAEEIKNHGYKNSSDKELFYYCKAVVGRAIPPPLAGQWAENLLTRAIHIAYFA